MNGGLPSITGISSLDVVRNRNNKASLTLSSRAKSRDLTYLCDVFCFWEVSAPARRDDKAFLWVLGRMQAAKSVVVSEANKA